MAVSAKRDKLRLDNSFSNDLAEGLLIHDKVPSQSSASVKSTSDDVSAIEYVDIGSSNKKKTHYKKQPSLFDERALKQRGIQKSIYFDADVNAAIVDACQTHGLNYSTVVNTCIRKVLL